MLQGAARAALPGVPLFHLFERGSGFLAGLATGFWKSKSELVNAFELERKFDPEVNKGDRDKLYKGWQKAVEKAKDWEDR